MAAIKGTQSQILVDEFNFSGDTAGFGVNVAMSEQECTTLESTGMEYEPILPSMTIEQNGYITALAETGELEAELKARLGSGASYVAALLGTANMGCPAYVLDGTFGSNMNIQAPATGLMTLNGAWGMARGGDRGIRIFAGTLDALESEAAIDLGAAGSAGGTAYLFVQAISGTATGADVLVESSATEGGVYATEATFTFSAVGGYKQAMSGAIDRWLRVTVNDLGGATSFTVVCIVCVNGVTQ